MFAIKLTKENLPKIEDVTPDWTLDVLEELLNDPLDIEDGIVRYMIPNYEGLSGWSGPVAIIAEGLEADFNYTPSDNDWFKITRK